MKAGCYAVSVITLAGVVANAFGASDPGAELPDHVRMQFLIRTNGSSRVFSQAVGGRSFVRNPHFWLRGVNGLAAIHAGYGPGATAITPWHVLGAGHWKHDAGSKLYFCDSQDRTVVRTVVTGTEIRPDIKSDIWLAVLDEALPGSIGAVALMPQNWAERLRIRRFPVAAMNQASILGCAELIGLNQPVNGWFLHGYSYSTATVGAAPRFEPLQAGDSGYPILTIIETNLVLLGHITLERGAAFAGPDYSSYAEDIQAAINTLGTNLLATRQRLSFADLSGFH